MDKPSQKKRVLAYMQIWGGITARDAVRELGVYRLAAIIGFLEEDGEQIQHTPEHDGSTHWTKYSLIKNNQPVLFN